MSAIDLNARASANFESKLAQTIGVLSQVARDYAPLSAGGAARISLACSLGAEDMVISHLINTQQLDIDIFVLETGMLHAKTIDLLARFQAASRAPVTVFRPVREATIEFVAREGRDAMYKSIALRKACCQIRKMEPLERALKGKAAWITGLRREQSNNRADVPLIDGTDAQRIKVNPLAEWTWGDVWHFIGSNRIDYNPLHDNFFPSIGCAPCTRAISQGEDFRAGRWWWEDEAAKECGLHANASSTLERAPL